MKAVVCDDDAGLRSVVSRLTEGAGHEVLAETDSAADAVELVTRFGAELLVLDLSLPFGSGMEAIAQLRDAGSDCRIVVFTAYADTYPDVRQAQVRAVIEKPDFDALEQVLNELATGLAGELPVSEERRRPWRERPQLPPPVDATPSGLEDPASFARAIDALEPGDAVLVVHVAGIDAGADEWGSLVRADRLLTVARVLRLALRTPDRMSIVDDQLAALLLDAGKVGVERVFTRLERNHELGSLPGVVSGGWVVHDGVAPPSVTFGRARAAAARSVGQPPGERLWAG